VRAVQQLQRMHRLVVLTNFATDDMRRKCIELGADRVFDKSHEIESLILYCSRLAAREGSDCGPITLS